ncbi:G-type lectin S-receptor-like serine/threonine-protein kinase LECRK3 [Vigna umbellata]|uniref:G-type lectin S-receptor-like serine/threonine-protein kinase LECRK3 n=1 Tax=Vigna umbellata TaxID=87088 RepID=UPI001F5F37B9|nr:G-type lectin S-receptor-like serine/threonine-protein kinase LECRK3 [Vigna umbellata]
MNDDGNFQLLDQNFVSLWESFTHPTDTLVPTQVMELGGELYSRQGQLNFSTGKFKLYLQHDGNLVLKLINLLSNYSNAVYFNTGTADLNNETNVGKRFVFDKSGFLYVMKKSGEKFNVSTSNDTISSNDVYYKATLNFDGVLTVSYYPKDPNKEQKWVTLKTIPENICLDSTFTDGGGVCGFNSICNLKDDQRPMCNCPEKYSLIDSNNMYGGCIPNFQVICQGGGQMGSLDDYMMKELQNTDWPKSDYETVSPCTLEQCTKSCSQDCLCVLVTFSGNSCWKKKLPLTNGRRGKEVNATSIMKLMKNDELLTPLPNKKMKEDHDTLIIVISVLLGFSVLVILMLVGTMYFGFSYNRKKIKSGGTNDGVVGKNLRNFTFKELVEATRNFSEELGRGSFSIVYKGRIDMTSVAVKKLDKLFQDNDKEFQTEVNVIGQTHHRNLVRLLGYCNEGQHRILVYEFMSNGTLASFLFTPLKANWRQRFDIASGIARGLVYLHEECCTQIIHCDIKPQNILLDDQCNARISDFGLAKLLLINQSHTETGIRGTKGYVAPDWFRSSPITTKVDTYSFGVLLLEIICCRRNVEKELADEEKGILTDWAYDCYKSRRLDILLENDDEAINNINSFEKFVMVALWCIHEDPSLRPTMKNVLLMLEGIIEVSKPPNPYLYSSAS